MVARGILRIIYIAAVLAAFAAGAQAGRFTDREKTKISWERPASVPIDIELEAAGAVDGNIEIAIRDIFDLNNPRENAGFYRLANKLHITTKSSTVRSQLLFKNGDSQPGLLKDIGMGLRFGNTCSGLGNVLHVDLALLLGGNSGI